MEKGHDIILGLHAKAEGASVIWVRLRADGRGAGHVVDVRGTGGGAAADRRDRSRRHDGSGTGGAQTCALPGPGRSVRHV